MTNLGQEWSYFERSKYSVARHNALSVSGKHSVGRHNALSGSSKYSVGRHDASAK